MNLYIEKLWQVPKHLNYLFNYSVTHFFVLNYCHGKCVSLMILFFPPFCLLGSNAAVNMEISESVGKMRIVSFHSGSTIMYNYTAYAESLQKI